MLSLIAANLLRAPARGLLAVASFAAASALFVLLAGIASAFGTGIPGEPYLHVGTARSYNVGFLPPTAVQTLRGTPGVELLTPLYKLPAYYQRPSNPFIVAAVSPEDYLAMFDLGLSAAARACFLETRNGAIATPALAARFDWQADDQVPLVSPHDLTRAGDNHWPFVFCGTFAPPKQAAFAFHAHFDYVDEYHIAPVRKYGQFIVKVARPAVLRDTAQAIDALFEGERHATESVPLDEQQRRHARLLADGFGGKVAVTLGAVVFALAVSILCAASQSVRQRRAEFAVLYTLGFGAGATLALAAGEFAALAFAGAALGIAPVLLFEDAVVEALLATVGRFEVSVATAAAGVGLATLLGGLAGAMPAGVFLRRPVAALLR